MSKEYEKQLLDCNCNDCKFLVRSFEKRQEHEDFHQEGQLKQFNQLKRNLLNKADLQWLKYLRGNQSKEEAISKRKALVKEAKSKVFQFDKGKCTLSYGYCTLKGVSEKKLKLVSFIPNTIQLETQHCFKHRLDE